MVEQDKNLYADVLSSPALSTERSNMAGQALAGVLAASFLTPDKPENAGVVLGMLGKADLLGGVLGYLAAKSSSLTQEGKQDLKTASNLSFIPGSAMYRDSLRNAYVDDKLSKGDNKHRSGLAELLGPAATSLIGGGIGAGVGALIGHGKNNTGDYAKLGGAIGMGSLALVSLFSAAVGRYLAGKRSNKNHAEYLKRSVVPHYIIPGVAAYNRGRRLAMMAEIN